MPLTITCGPDGNLYDWHSGLCVTPQGVEAIPPECWPTPGTCPMCQRSRALVFGICTTCADLDYHVDSDAG